MNGTQGSRPLMAAVASQQRVIQEQRSVIDRLQSGLEMIAYYAGLTPKLADILNPASPVADPPEAAPSETTEQAATPSAADDPRNLGITPGSTEHLPAAETTTALTPGVSINTSPFNQLLDVTAPVSGTPTHVPEEQTRLEVDVRVGDPDDPTKNFPLNPEFQPEPSTGANDADMRARSSRTRTLAALKLAKLRVTAGIERGDELEVAGHIEAEAGLTDEIIAHEINVLSAVTKFAQRARKPNPGLVPRQAGVQRTVPSLATEHTASTIPVAAELDDSDIFLS